MDAESHKVHLDLQETLRLGYGCQESLLLGGGLSRLARMPFVMSRMDPDKTGIWGSVEDAESLHRPLR